MILVAPPAVAFTAWLRLEGEVGAFGHFLLSAAYVFALLVATQAAKLRKLPFALSWWALSFPIAALAIASFGYAHAAGSDRTSLDRGGAAGAADRCRCPFDISHGTGDTRR